MLRKLIVLFGLVVMAAPAAAQKRCTKGIPCGNSCIAAGKTCRIGSSEPPPKIEQGRISAPDTMHADSAAWVGSKSGTTYYKAGCEGSKGLATRNLITFKTEDEAKKAGYHRSSQRGC